MAEPGDRDHRAARRSIRRDMRASRRGLDAATRQAADRALVRNILSWGPYRRARRVALYLAFDGEPDLSRLIAVAHRQGKELYVPSLKGHSMSFVRLPPKGTLAKNFFGILEPPRGGRIDARQLDLVLTPLVAFDTHGTRIGVGRGYYDRCFGFLLRRQAWLHPKLAGVAYSLQCAPTLDRQAWDVPLWAAVTEKSAQIFAQGPSK
jgi:5-formyltetrahydrofolate cyclo-ligase